MSDVAAQILEKTASPTQQAPPAPDVGGLANKDVIQAPSNDPKVSSKMEALIRREQEARSIEVRARQKEAEIEAKLKALEDREKRVREFEEVKTKDPSKALDLMGMTYDELTQAQLQGQVPPEVHMRKIEERFNQFETKQQEDKRREDEEKAQAQQRQLESATNNFKQEISTYLEDNKSRYELIAFEGYQDTVYEVIDEHYTRTLKAAQEAYAQGEIPQDQVVGKVMKITEAADKVEQYLEDKYNRSRDTSKVKALWSAVPKNAIEAAAKQNNQPVRQSPRTLTNQLASQPSPSTKKGILTDQERVAKAVAYAREKGFAS